jgi:hypothetical protein
MSSKVGRGMARRFDELLQVILHVMENDSLQRMFDMSEKKEVGWCEIR